MSALAIRRDAPAARSRLRILHVLPSLGPGGGEHMACHLMTGMADLHSVGALNLGGKFDTFIERRLRQAGVPMWFLNKRPGFDPHIFLPCDRVLREFRPDVVHTHMSVLRYVLPAIIHHGVRLAVHTLHNVAEHETDGLGRALQWLAFRGLVKPVAISREVASSIERVYGVKAPHMVPNCIPVEKYRAADHPAVRMRWRAQEGIDPEAVLFISVARFEPQKNPFLLLEAFARLRDPRARLALIGHGRQKDEVIRYIQSRGLERSIRMLGVRGDVPECLAASDVFVLSSNWEGNPLSVMEAMSAGLPVISTAVGGVPELVESGRNGLLVAAKDCAAFGAAMQFLLDHPETRASMSSAARVHAAAAFNLDRMIRGYCAIYESALGEQ
jgi:glycosyltransferase involved in cell wall biosynthesis